MQKVKALKQKRVISLLYNRLVGSTDLAKKPSDFKQNGTQEKTPFSGTVFNTLSHGVIRFVASVSFKNH